MKTDRNATNTFAIFCLFFFLDVRASELSAIHRDYHPDKDVLIWITNYYISEVHGEIIVYQNKTKNRGSKRSIEIDEKWS